MLSIDEAIAFERQQAKDKRNEHYTFGIQKSKEAAEEHEQLADWLEELKAYKEIGTVEGYKNAIECYTEEYLLRRNLQDQIKEQYNKAIDDAKSVILQTIDNEILVDTLHLRLEQLKERNMENEEIEELDFSEWWEMLDDIEREEYNRCMKELEESDS